MINYWTFDCNVKDIIGGADLYNGLNTSFTSDSSGKTNFALSLNTGYYQVPNGIYFSGGDLTISLWLKLKAYGTASPRILDFGLSNCSNDIVLCHSLLNGKLLFAPTDASLSKNPYQASSVALKLNQ